MYERSREALVHWLRVTAIPTKSENRGTTRIFVPYFFDAPLLFVVLGYASSFIARLQSTPERLTDNYKPLGGVERLFFNVFAENLARRSLIRGLKITSLLYCDAANTVAGELRRAFFATHQLHFCVEPAPIYCTGATSRRQTLL